MRDIYRYESDVSIVFCRQERTVQVVTLTDSFNNPIATTYSWVVNTNQISQASLDDSDATLQTKRDPKTGEKIIVRKLSFFQTVKKIYKKDGIAAFWRGLGPALVLVINPIIAYTAFEQIRNFLIARRAGAAQLKAVSNGITAKPAVSPLSDLDNFLLGAVRTIIVWYAQRYLKTNNAYVLQFTKLIATGTTYPYLVVKVSKSK
jgi:adenine nucleotide transporter 17